MTLIIHAVSVFDERNERVCANLYCTLQMSMFAIAWSSKLGSDWIKSCDR